MVEKDTYLARKRVRVPPCGDRDHSAEPEGERQNRKVLRQIGVRELDGPALLGKLFTDPAQVAVEDLRLGQVLNRRGNVCGASRTHVSPAQGLGDLLNLRPGQPPFQ